MIDGNDNDRSELLELILAIGLMGLAMLMVTQNGMWATELKMIIGGACGFLFGRATKRSRR